MTHNEQVDYLIQVRGFEAVHYTDSLPLCADCGMPIAHPCHGLDSNHCGESGELDTVDLSCNQCEAMMIQGVYCHETGCPNAHKVKVYGEWENEEDADSLWQD